MRPPILALVLAVALLAACPEEDIGPRPEAAQPAPATPSP